MAGGVVDERAVGADAGDVADLGEGVQVEDADVGALAGARDVEVAVGGVGGDVIESAFAAADFDGLEDFVGAGLGEHGEGSRAARAAIAASASGLGDMGWVSWRWVPW